MLRCTGLSSKESAEASLASILSFIFASHKSPVVVLENSPDIWNQGGWCLQQDFDCSGFFWLSWISCVSIGILRLSFQFLRRTVVEFWWEFYWICKLHMVQWPFSQHQSSRSMRWGGGGGALSNFWHLLQLFFSVFVLVSFSQLDTN